MSTYDKLKNARHAFYNEMKKAPQWSEQSPVTLSSSFEDLGHALILSEDIGELEHTVLTGRMAFEMVHTAAKLAYRRYLRHKESGNLDNLALSGWQLEQCYRLLDVVVIRIESMPVNE